jgi:HlyD family secretion protein
VIKDTSATDIQISQQPKYYKFVLIALAAIAVLFIGIYAFVGQASASRSVDRASVQIASLEVGDLVRDVLANGSIVAANAPQLYSPEQGFVSLRVKAGDKVTVGQVLAVVDSPELQNQLQQEQSEYTRLQGELARQELDARRQALQLAKLSDLAQVDLQAAQREERRAQASIVNNLISQIDHEKAVDDLARAQLTFKHSQQELELANDTLAFELDSARSTVARQALVVDELTRKTERLQIVANVTGVVGNLLVQPQAFVSKNQQLMTLVDLSAYEAQLKVPESYANDLSVGMDVEITVQGRTILGELSGISPEVVNREVITRVRFDQSELQQGIRQNQQVSARILLENKSRVLKVRRGSFVQAGGFVAYKLEGDVAYRTDIQLGATSMREVEILSGLDENDRIIISNYSEFENAPSIQLN